MADLFSVVIPTLQRSARLIPLLRMYCEHPLVGEVIVINNVQDPLPFDDPKVRVIQPGGNIFVNPAWNLGVELAVHPLLIISNDDIDFAPTVIDMAARLLRLPVGIVGPHPRSFTRRRSWMVWATPAYLRTYGFGTLMFLRADRWSPIPDDIKVWAGDNWVFYRQHHRNVHLRGIAIDTEMSTTSGSSEFDAIKRRDDETYRGLHTSAYADRYWLGTRGSVELRRLRRAMRPLGRVLRRARSGVTGRG